MILAATMVISLFMDCVAAEFFMLGIVHEIFDMLGFKKGDKWPKYMVIAITFTVILAFAMTPICHTSSILFMGVYSGNHRATGKYIGVYADWNSNRIDYLDWNVTLVPICG